MVARITETRASSIVSSISHHHVEELLIYTNMLLDAGNGSRLALSLAAISDATHHDIATDNVLLDAIQHRPGVEGGVLSTLA